MKNCTVRYYELKSYFSECAKTYLLQKQPPEVLYKKGVLKNFANLTGKHLRESLFFNKVPGLRTKTLLEKRLWHRCFPVKFARFFKNTFFTEHLRASAFDAFLFDTHSEIILFFSGIKIVYKVRNAKMLWNIYIIHLL